MAWRAAYAMGYAGLRIATLACCARPKSVSPIAGGGSLLMGQASEGLPVVHAAVSLAFRPGSVRS